MTRPSVRIRLDDLVVLRAGVARGRGAVEQTRPQAGVVRGAGWRLHRAWFEPVRRRLQAGGFTLDELVSLSGYSKTCISELLRGKGYYPGWEITYSVVRPLNIPLWPLRRLWTAAARDANKAEIWITNRIDKVQPLQPERPPLAHQGFTESMRQPYASCARAFLQNDQRAQWAVSLVFDVLWLSWNEAAASPDVRRRVWCLLRSHVALRAHAA